MTTPRALMASAASVAAVAAFYGLARHDWAGGIVTGLLAAVLVWAVVLACQRSRARQWHLDLDGRVADLERNMRGALATSEAARATAVRASADKTAEVIHLRDHFRDHLHDPNAHARRPAGVPGPRRTKEGR